MEIKVPVLFRNSCLPVGSFELCRTGTGVVMQKAAAGCDVFMLCVSLAGEALLIYWRDKPFSSSRY